MVPSSPTLPRARGTAIPGSQWAGVGRMSMNGITSLTLPEIPGNLIPGIQVSLQASLFTNPTAHILVTVDTRINPLLNAIADLANGSVLVINLPPLCSVNLFQFDSTGAAMSGGVSDSVCVAAEYLAVVPYMPVAY